MAIIFKRNGRDKYYIKYKNAAGKWTVTPGFTDKVATEEKARQLERHAQREQAGLPVAQQAKRHAPIEQIRQEWEADLTRLGRSYRTIKDYRSLSKAIFTACNWSTLAEVRLDAFSRFLATLRKAPRTLNAYRGTLFAFMRFCCAQGYAEANPLEHFRPARNNKVRLRRAYTPAEFTALCQLLPHGPLYLVAGLSGFRRNELRLMEKRDLNPYADPPAWQPRQQITKGRRQEVIPIRQELLPAIRQLWDALPTPTSRLFSIMPKNATFRKDLAKANVTRLDQAGRYADFHSFRYFFCTQLAKVLPIHSVQRFMRHKDVRMTSALYNDLGLTDLWEQAQATPLPIQTPSLVTPVVTLPEKPANSQRNHAHSA
jgi:integrase